MITATYSAEDNKIRLYSTNRLDAETYSRVKAAGFVWAPKQGLFVAPSWSPLREDLALELAGEIDDEDYSPEERAADRAERFAGYRDKRTAEALDGADRFEAGPDAFGHQNRDRAERQAARHDRLRTNAVTQWRKAEYWQRRTADVISHALFKSDPVTRRGRIKTLEAELRSVIAKYTPTDNPPHIVNQKAYDYASGQYRFDGAEVPHVWCGPKGRGGFWVPVASLEDMKAGCARWVEHLENRLTYERAMLANEGGTMTEAEIEVGGWVGRYQIHGVTRSPVTKKIVSVKLMSTEKWGNEVAPYLKSVNIERFPENAYRAPTDAEREQFAASTKERKAKEKATKPAPTPLINPTDADAQRLQDVWNEYERKRFVRQYGENCTYATFKPSEVVRMTQKEYSERSKGTYARCKTITIGEHLQENFGRDRVELFTVRRAERPEMYGAGRVIVITDKPQKPLPFDKAAEVIANAPKPEDIRPRLTELGAILSRSCYGNTPEEKSLVSDAAYVGWCHGSWSRCGDSGWTEKGRAEYSAHCIANRATLSPALS